MSVTAAGVRRSRAPTSHRLFGAVLAVSLALNLCFIAGATWSRLNPPPAPLTASERFRHLAAALDLTAEQKLAYEAYVAGMLARSKNLRQGIEPLLDAAWSEIGKPNPDEARVRQLFEDAGTWRRAFQKEALAATLTLLDTLTPDQRSKFIAGENDRHAAARRRRFDESR